jgi:hypothetical protein
MEELGPKIGSIIGHPWKALMGKTSLVLDGLAYDKLVD